VEPVALHCLGGFVIAVRYGLARSTADLDYLEDVAHLARAIPLDPHILRERYQQELRPIISGDLARHDHTLALWLELYFP